MNPTGPILAQTSIARGPLTEPLGRMPASTGEVLTVLSALGILTLALVLWAAFVRKRRRPYWRRHRHHHSHWQPKPPQSGNGDSPPHQQHHRRRRRRRHREPGPRNPTLAQTGGLPPARPPAPPEAWS